MSDYGAPEVIATGLRFPEGPVPMADGSVLLVEIARGTLTRALPDGSLSVVAQLGGGPNGLAIGPDGAAYVRNNGGFRWIEARRPALPRPRGKPRRRAGRSSASIWPPAP